MFKKKYRIRENKKVETVFDFRYTLEVKFRLIPFIWWEETKSDDLSRVRYWYDRRVNPSLHILQESGWI